MFKTILSLRYYSQNHSLGFSQHEVQDFFINRIAMPEITVFSLIIDPEWEDEPVFVPSEHLLNHAGSVKEIIMDGDNHLYWGFALELTNGIKIQTDLNVTYVIAPDKEALFCYCSPLFTFCNLDPLEVINLIVKNPNQKISLTELEESEDPESPF